MLLAKTIMKKDVFTVRPQDTLDKVIRILIQHNITGMPVVNDDMTLAGVITEKDVLHYLLDKQSLELLNDDVFCEHTVFHAMTADIVSFDENTPVHEITECLMTRNFRRVPIIDKDGRLAGIISRKDIIAVIS